MFLQHTCLFDVNLFIEDKHNSFIKMQKEMFNGHPVDFIFFMQKLKVKLIAACCRCNVAIYDVLTMLQ